MSQHEGVSCDSCLKRNFLGKRYKCLICLDYDLCAACHDSGNLSGRHTGDHPMQCILTRDDSVLYFSGEINIEQLYSFTCPICGKLGFTVATLHEHVNASHGDNSIQVVCPICATLPDGEPNQVSDDFLTHLNLEHRESSSNNEITSLNNNNRELEEPQIVRIRSRHVRLNNNRRGRSQFFNSNSTTTSNRDGTDPIAQLLSQLTDVRRVNRLESNGQNLQVQLQLERQSAAGTRLPLERIMQRQRRQTAQVSSVPLTSTQAVDSNTLQSPYMVFLDSTASPSNNNSLTSNAVASANTLNSLNSDFLLSGSLTNFLPENESSKLDTLKADRAIFLQELIFASMTNSFNIDEILSVKVSQNEDSKVIDSEKTTQENDNNKISCQSNNNSLKENSIDESTELINHSMAAAVLADKTMNIQNETGGNEHSVHNKCLENINFSTMNQNENNGNRQKSSLTSLNMSSYIHAVSPSPQTSVNSNHRNNKVNKVRNAVSTTANLSVPLRTTNGPSLNIVSPSGRRKILKQTDPPPN